MHELWKMFFSTLKHKIYQVSKKIKKEQAKQK